MTRQTLHYGDLHIGYRVAFVSDRRLAIHVYPNGEVRVDAPRDADLRDVKSAVLLRARWISVRLAQIDARAAHVLAREYVSGESHLYLGKRYTLKIVPRQTSDPSVRLIRGQIQVTTRDPACRVVRSMLWDWYKARAREVFQRRLEQSIERLPWLRAAPRWQLLTMKKQWGSCSPGGVLNLNPHLIKAPTACIDYVLLHELCHLRFHDHGKGYYRLLGRHMPGWKEVKARLDGMAELLLNA
jgi:predicted metal-dependent hydrolase